MFKYKVTVFTPTYNRGYVIEQAYRSLCRQTIKNFEWVVIDDGSTDDTTEKFETWVKQDNGFPICYRKVPNGGKMRAVNIGLQLARGELFLNLDSDDRLTETAIETVLKWELTVQDQKERYAGVAGLRCYFDGRLIGTTFNGEYLDASVLDREKYGISGDRVEVFYTELLRRHPFPEIEGEKFISEGVTWMEICYEEQRILRWFNEKIYQCEYLKDGYSHQGLSLSLRNPKGLCLNIKKQIRYRKPSYKEKLYLWHSYVLVARQLGYSGKKIRVDLEITMLNYIAVLVGKRVLSLLKGFK